MQDKPRKPQQYIDGFINNRPRARVSGSTPQQPTLRSRLVANKAHTPAPSRPATTAPAGPNLQREQPRNTAAKTPVSPVGRRRPGTNPQQTQKRSWRRATKRTALIAVAILLIGGGWFGWKVYQNTSKVFGNDNPLQMLSAFKPVPLKGEKTGHVNILLAGNSADRSDGGGGNLTDSVMVVSINTKTNEAFMLSIPRDLWVDIPGIGGSKINAANTVTNFKENGYATGGMGMLQKVVSDNFGIDLHYYALVNYTAFKQAVDTVGGIDVQIKSEDPRGIYDPSFRPHEGGPLKLANGTNHLDGQTALNLARARGDPFNGVAGAYGFPQSDFSRTEHQRQMMMALREKGMNMKVLSNPTKLGSLMDAVGNNIATDFKVNELVSLYHLAKKINSSHIQSLSLNNAEGRNLLSNYMAPSGQSALAPAAGVTDFSAIQAYVHKAINATPVTKEAAKVNVLNGGQIAGLAKTKGDELAKKGMIIGTVSDAPQPRDTTVIIDNSSGKKPATKKLLQQMFKNSTVSSDAALAQQFPGDFTVILGANEKAPDSQAADDEMSTI